MHSCGAFLLVASVVLAALVAHLSTSSVPLPPNTAAFADAARPLAVVTGANSGVGLETARALLARGYDVIVAARSAARGSAAAAALNAASAAAAAAEPGAAFSPGHAAFQPLDLANLSSVVAFALALRAAGRAPAALVLNAGMNVRMGESAAQRRTVDGFEIAMQSNFLGHWLLTDLLLPRMLLHSAAAAAPGGGAPSRVVTLSSAVHRIVSAARCRDWPATFAAAGAYNYDASKLAMTSLALRLSRQLARIGSPTAALAVNPGAVLCQIWAHWPEPARAIARPAMQRLFLTPAQGAAPVVAAAADRALAPAAARDGGGTAELRSGDYLLPYAVLSPLEPLATLGELMGPFAGVRRALPSPVAADEAIGDALAAAAEQALRPALAAYAAAVARGQGADGAGAAPAAAAGADGVLDADAPFSAQYEALLAHARKAL